MLDIVDNKLTKSHNSLVLERYLLKKLYLRLGSPEITLTLWDGFSCGDHTKKYPGIHIRNRKTFWRLITHPDLHFGEDYGTGNIILQGDLVELLEAIYRSRRNRLLHETGNRRSRKRYAIDVLRAKQNAMHHYDISNDFYRLWLDDDMVYTCAYFPVADISLEQAQAAKFEHICRKLQLKIDETVYEAGCGWGGLAIYMAKHYGVKVKAYNVSAAQIAFATHRAKTEGFSERVEFIEADYRKMQGQCDVFVSIGMVEHVGAGNYQSLGQVIDRVLAENGRGLIHNISQNQPDPTNPWVLKYIFPNGYSPTLREMMDIFEPYDLSVMDVENLRLHYATTLRHWLARFEENSQKISDMFDEDFVRMWRLYLSASIANFTSGSLQLYQVLFHRPDVSDLPLTRDHIYVTPGVNNRISDRCFLA